MKYPPSSFHRQPDNKLIFFWIGDKPLPLHHIALLSKIATPGIMDVILIADHPHRISEQITANAGNALLDSARLKIRPISDLFKARTGIASAEHQCDLMLDALQARERDHEGSMGARVDILKIQALHRAGNDGKMVVIADFDKMQTLDKDNHRTLGTAGLLKKINALCETQTILFDTDTNQPDFIIGKSGSEDTQLLREIIVKLAVANATTLCKDYHPGTLYSNEETIDEKDTLSLHKKDPLSYLPSAASLINSRSNALTFRDMRRSHDGWQMNNNPEPSGENGLPLSVLLTYADSGNVLALFSQEKAKRLAPNLYALDHYTDIVKQAFPDRTPLDESKKYASIRKRIEKVATVPDDDLHQMVTKAICDKTSPFAAIKSFISAHESATKNAHHITSLLPTLALNAIYEHSWIKRNNQRPPEGYTPIIRK